MWWKGAHTAYSCWSVFLLFFLQRPEVKINYYNHADTMYNLSATCQQKLLKHLMFISGRVDIFSPKIWTQDNIDDQTHKITKQLICNNRRHLNVSKSRRDSYYLSPLQSYSWHTLRNKRHVWSGSKDSFKMNSPIKHSFNGWFINKEEFCPVHCQCMANL